jgi:hypothetical protein
MKGKKKTICTEAIPDQMLFFKKERRKNVLFKAAPHNKHVLCMLTCSALEIIF